VGHLSPVLSLAWGRSDAFLLRTILVPVLMHLSGRANWWLPGWLDRILPHLSIEPATQLSALLIPAPESQVAGSPAARGT
jgi:putative drug exporter of the RND superfamily